MINSAYNQIKNRIIDANEGSVFVNSDFSDITSSTNIRKYLGRLVEEKLIRRVIQGVYEKPVYSTIMKKNIHVNPDDVAHAIARGFHWTIAPCGDVALDKLGLVNRIIREYTYISDGPYREYEFDNIKILFKHRANREISLMSENTCIIVEAIRTIGKEDINMHIDTIRKVIKEEDKTCILQESKGVSDWIYQALKLICMEGECYVE